MAKGEEWLRSLNLLPKLLLFVSGNPWKERQCFYFTSKAEQVDWRWLFCCLRSWSLSYQPPGTSICFPWPSASPPAISLLCAIVSHLSQCNSLSGRFFLELSAVSESCCWELYLEKLPLFQSLLCLQQLGQSVHVSVVTNLSFLFAQLIFLTLRVGALQAGRIFPATSLPLLLNSLDSKALVLSLAGREGSDKDRIFSSLFFMSSSAFSHSLFNSLQAAMSYQIFILHSREPVVKRANLFAFNLISSFVLWKLAFNFWFPPSLMNCLFCLLRRFLFSSRRCCLTPSLPFDRDICCGLHFFFHFFPYRLHLSPDVQYLLAILLWRSSQEIHPFFISQRRTVICYEIWTETLL